MKKDNASISIFFIVSIVLIISVILSVTEIARINCQKLYLQLATDSALDSMASLYHRDLYEYYSLYGVEYRTNEMLEEEYLGYMMPYIRDLDTGLYIDNWYIGNIDENRVSLDCRTILDDANLEKEIINYIKYRFVGKIIKFLGKDITITKNANYETLLDEVKKNNDDLNKSSIYSVVYERYFNFVDSIESLESYAKNVKDNIDRTNVNLNMFRSLCTNASVSSAASAKNSVDNIVDCIERVISNLNSYKVKMADFRNLVQSSRNHYLSDKASGTYEFSDDTCRFIEEEFECFLSFVDESSDINRSVESKITESRGLQSIMSEIRSNVKSYADEIDSIDDEIAEESCKPRDEKDKSLINDLKKARKELLKDLADYLKDLRDEIIDLRLEQINLDTSSGNKTRESNTLKSIIACKDDTLLRLVLDQEKIDKIDRSVVTLRTLNVLSQNNSLSIDKILLGEYELDKFNYYNKVLNNEGTTSENTGLEVERLINGKNSDIENLKATINRILLIRVGMNVLHIYKSSEKRQLARNFAYVTFAGFSRLLAEAMFLLIITAWGTAQGIQDVRKLLNNKRVNFMHDNTSWTVDIDSVLSTMSGTHQENIEHDDRGIAYSYKDYLRVLLIATNQGIVDERLAAIVDGTLKKKQDNFDIMKLIYSFQANNDFTAKHFFTKFVFVGASNERLYDEYTINTQGYRCFFE